MVNDILILRTFLNSGQMLYQNILPEIFKRKWKVLPKILIWTWKCMQNDSIIYHLLVECVIQHKFKISEEIKKNLYTFKL